VGEPLTPLSKVLLFVSPPHPIVPLRGYRRRVYDWAAEPALWEKPETTSDGGFTIIIGR
jgi:hypothetical protein